MGDISAIVQGIKAGTAIAVSDGSFKEGCRAAAWTIKGADATDEFTGVCLVPGLQRIIVPFGAN